MRRATENPGEELNLRVTPSGRLVADADNLPRASRARGIASAFDSGQAQGLFALAALKTPSSISPALDYWRAFAQRFVTALCHAPDPASPVPPPGEGERASLLLSAPPMPGAEYLSPQTFEDIWRELDMWVREEVRRSESGLEGFLAKRAPQFRAVGRVCFHLAENKRDPELPFAFLATYTSGLSQSGEVRHVPLSRALEEYAGARNREALVRLLSPVSRACEKSPFIRDLVDGGGVYQPLAWTPDEAYRFLCEVPGCEEAGLVVRVPNWWSRRPRARVRVTLGDDRKTRIGMDALLDFRLEVALGDRVLDEEELESLLDSGRGLVRIKGEWVEVDREKLRQALDHWQRVSELAGNDGLTFIQGMRLLAGASPDLAVEEGSEEADPEWSFVRAGKGLRGVLEGLRAPETISASRPGRALRTTLRPYQQEGVSWLLFLTGLGLGACLADDMGLGKTVQVIAQLLALRKRKTTGPGGKRPSLLVLPASLLSNWKAEIEKFAPSLVVRFHHPSEVSKEDMEALEAEARARPDTALSGVDALLTTYGMLTRSDWLLDVPWELAVLDEAQAIKNPGTRQSRTVKKIRASGRVVLTGTPVENRLTDLWSLFDFLCPGLLGSHARFTKFAKSLESRERDRYAPLRRLVGPYILRRLKTDRRVAPDLPDKTEVRVFCGLSKAQAALYLRLTEELREVLESSAGIKRRGLVLSQLMRLKQLCNHPSQLLGDGEYRPSDSGKFARLAEIAEEVSSRGEKALVFTQFRELTEPLSEFLAGVFHKPGLVLHGGTPVSRRKDLVDAFQREEGPPFFVLSVKAGGTGLNLTEASHVVLFDRWWNPAVESQAMDRAFRIGQKKNVLVHKFLCRGTVEERIDALLEEKSAMAGEILDAGAEKKLTEMSDDDLIDFVSLDIRRAEM